VFKKGEPVAADGLVVGSHQEGGAGVSMPSSMHVAGFDAGRLQLPLRDEAHVIRIAPGQITTEHLVVPSERYTSGADDIIKLVVVERHRGTGNIGLGLVSGFGIRNGAIGSTVAHDSHNIIVAGDNDRDIMLAIAEIVKLRGGLVVAGSGRVLASLALPLGGLMSDQGSGRVLEGLRQVAGAAHQLGAPAGFDSFMTLSFLSLPVIPKLRLTDRGLVDVEKFAIIPL
jgi:adenine deaminase